MAKGAGRRKIPIEASANPWPSAKRLPEPSRGQEKSVEGGKFLPVHAPLPGRVPPVDGATLPAQPRTTPFLVQKRGFRRDVEGPNQTELSASRMWRLWKRIRPLKIFLVASEGTWCYDIFE